MRTFHRLLLESAAVLWLAALPASAATYYVTVAGLGGEPEYEQRFAAWAQEIDKYVKAGAARVVTLHGPDATRDRVRAALEAVARDAGPQDAFVLMLIGHGTYDNVEYKFNLPGPDISGGELATLLDRIRARQLIVNMTSASGACLELWSKPNRVVITATKSGTEKNATLFARFWVEALREPAADTDKNETVSAAEAFRYAEQKTAKFYESQKRLATEHARMEGDAASSFIVARFGQASAALNDPAKRQLLERREQLEQKIDELKLQKAAMPSAEYRKQLTALLVELAKTQAELDK
ncbi:MAG TPA: hypothetical protein PLA43_09620 [Bryobacteraceae bacterium]|nr:hypothetical protein [Bryobacteraceae bacterium]HOQ46358.1 hypothetical protein [Bryobacteraceae bacterium]HPQ15588.1 hypothetical protein [Bryobacteraceae bacterium]HPU72205.1 hypothetical protein [Bryobacteraceae bacterium]